MSYEQPLPAVPSWRPVGFHSITPSIQISKDQALEAIDWYVKALGAANLGVHKDTKNPKKVMHSTLRIGDSNFFVNDVFAEMGDAAAATNSAFYVYVEHVDAAYKRAVQEGAVGKQEPKDQFWGDRSGFFLDPYGQRWNFATPIPGFDHSKMHAPP